MRSGAVDVIVIDSVAALVPKAEIEGEMGDSHMGLQARLMSQALRKLAGAINRSNCAVVFINQLREKIGVMFGNPETTTGGKALKFYASVRLDIRRIGPVKESEEVIGNHVRVKVVKNKVAPPFKQAEFDIMFDEGISHASLLVDIASEANIIQKSGAWYSYGDQRIGQGRENAKLFLKDNPALMAEVEDKVKDFLGMKAGAAAAVADGRRGVGDAESCHGLVAPRDHRARARSPAPGRGPGAGRRHAASAPSTRRRSARRRWRSEPTWSDDRAPERPAAAADEEAACRALLRALERRQLRPRRSAPPAAAEGPSRPRPLDRRHRAGPGGSGCSTTPHFARSYVGPARRRGRGPARLRRDLARMGVERRRRSTRALAAQWPEPERRARRWPLDLAGKRAEAARRTLPREPVSAAGCWPTSARRGFTGRATVTESGAARVARPSGLAG